MKKALKCEAGKKLRYFKFFWGKLKSVLSLKICLSRISTALPTAAPSVVAFFLSSLAHVGEMGAEKKMESMEGETHARNTYIGITKTLKYFRQNKPYSLEIAVK